MLSLVFGHNSSDQNFIIFSAQNDFITGSLKVAGAVGIVDPVKQLIEKEELWGQVGKKLQTFACLFKIPSLVGF